MRTTILLEILNESVEDRRISINLPNIFICSYSANVIFESEYIFVFTNYKPSKIDFEYYSTSMLSVALFHLKKLLAALGASKKCAVFVNRSDL